jgi:hypothetical protein
MAAFLSQLQSKTPVALRAVDESVRKDRSAANTSLAGADVLSDEAERWAYFFNSGVSAWFESIKARTFTSTFCALTQEEAAVIVRHWEERGRAVARSTAAGEGGESAAVADLLAAAITQLQPLCERLDAAVQEEIAISPCGLAFVKLCTRSPKDSKKALVRAAAAFKAATAAAERAGSPLDANDRWRLLSEEATRSVAVRGGADALELLLDSSRVHEDLEYALRGPPAALLGTATTDTAGAEDGSDGAAARPPPAPAAAAALPLGSPQLAEKAWVMSLVARAWDPRLTPQSEFRGICWGGELTCLCQYFHPLLFPELHEPGMKQQVERDIRQLYDQPDVRAAVAKLGGHCMVDFAWLAPGVVVIVELNPFDGVCLGTFPASTGLFLWDVAEDQAVMRGDAPFEFRLREALLEESKLRNECNADWRGIVYGEGEWA